MPQFDSHTPPNDFQSIEQLHALTVESRCIHGLQTLGRRKEAQSLQGALMRLSPRLSTPASATEVCRAMITSLDAILQAEKD